MSDIPDINRKHMNPNHLRRTIHALTLDWLTLQQTPTPTAHRFDEPKRTSNTHEYGHPNEWASDTARDITDKLTAWHDYLAEHRNETRPRRKRTRRRPDGLDEWQYATNQQDRLKAAWKYLEPRIEQLTQLVDKEPLQELIDLHNHIKATLGLNTPKYILPIPCPSTDCGLKTLTRVTGINKQEFIACDACGYTIRDTYYPLLIRMSIDAFITSTEPANCTCTLTASGTPMPESDALDALDDDHPDPPQLADRHWGFSTPTTETTWPAHPSSPTEYTTSSPQPQPPNTAASNSAPSPNGSAKTGYPRSASTNKAASCTSSST